MTSQYIAPPFRLVAIPSGGGYQSRFWALPLAVICVGVLWSSFLLKVIIVPSQAEGPNLAAPSGNKQQSLPLSPVFTPEVQYWAPRILKWAQAADIDPNLVATVMQIESCGDPRALSRSGAIGLFQVMPYHFTASDDPYSPDTNALRGLDYLRRSLGNSPWRAAPGACGLQRWNRGDRLAGGRTGLPKRRIMLIGGAASMPRHPAARKRAARACRNG